MKTESPQETSEKGKEKHAPKGGTERTEKQENVGKKKPKVNGIGK